MRADNGLLRRSASGAAAMVAGLAILFALAAWTGSAIPRNGDWQPSPANERDVVEILIGHNGVHTEIAMPAVTAHRDWHALFPVTDLAAPTRPYTHVAVSWGERAFFLDTPTWSELNPLTAARALIGGEGVVHVAHYVRPVPSEDYRVLRLRAEEYRALATDIAARIDPASARETIPGYDRFDVFYTARGTYHIGNTCNQWTSDRLANAGIRSGTWTPLPSGVMQWVPRGGTAP
ncbi:MAG: DUF2459 domain-containing protein [Erythrobacter sp.]